jgi:LPXTG-motif cell wall-anchored protein
VEDFVISKRGLAAATATGAGAVLLAAGAASACALTDYTAKVACDSSLGQAAITVSDSNPGYTAANLAVYNQSGTEVGSATLGASAPSITVDVPWAAQSTWTVTITVQDKKWSKYANGTIKTDVSANVTCATSTTPTTSAPTPTPSTPAVSASTPASPSAKPSSTTVAVVATSPAATSATPSTTLAETGSSGTGMIATLAGVLVAAGGGALYMLRRRSAGSHS